MRRFARNTIGYLFHEAPELLVVIGLFAALFVFVTGAGWMEASAKARMYEQVTGVKVDRWDIFWGGSPPSMDVRVRTEERP